MSKSVYFISDLHLCEGRPVTTRAFEQFLTSMLQPGDTLYILGDFFEAWVGDDDSSPFIEHIKTLLKAASTDGATLFFMRGNRDFFIGKRFCRETNMTLLKDPTVIEINDERILLSHGDFLCTDDHKHQRFRRITENTLYRALFLLLPLKLRRHIGKLARQKSQGRVVKTPEILDVNQHTVIEWMTEHKVKCFIHGHTHRPATHELTINNQPAKRIVLSDWHDEYTFYKV